MDEILCGDDPHGFTKPDPRNIFYICDKLTVNLKNTVMVGDSAGKFQDVAVYSHCALSRDQIKDHIYTNRKRTRKRTLSLIRKRCLFRSV